MTIKSAYSDLQKISAAENDYPYPQLNEKQVLVSAQQLLPAVKILQKNNIYHLSTITGVYDQDQLYLLYHFWEEEGITLRIPIDSDEFEVHTLTKTIPGALFYEREIAEMFGVRIAGLDTSGKMFLPDNWEGGAPMNKEFPDKSVIKKSEDQ